MTFVASGGVDLGPNTWIELLLVLVGVVATVAVLLIGAPGRRWGAVTLSLFVALVALTRRVRDLVGPARRVVDRGRPDPLLPGRVRQRDRARAAVSAALAGR